MKSDVPSGLGLRFFGGDPISSLISVSAGGEDFFDFFSFAILNEAGAVSTCTETESTTTIRVFVPATFVRRFVVVTRAKWTTAPSTKCRLAPQLARELKSQK